MDDLKRLGDLADLEPHGQFSKWIEGHDILVYRLDGEIKAISNEIHQLASEKNDRYKMIGNGRR